MSLSDKDWWRGSVFYQIYPRSFFDSNGDGIGDLKGITRKLDHIADLGVDAIWISPFYASPMVDFGYDVSDYQSIDPLFGTMQDFEEMLSAIHGRGLKLIIDMVLSHTSDQHPWFQQSRQGRNNSKSDWYVWADPKPDGSPPNNWLSVFGGPAWRYDTRRGQYYLHQFLESQPDLNMHNEDVQQALLDMMAWWLDKGVDGFRLDAVNHCFHDPLLRDNPPKEDADRSGADRQTHPYYWQRHLYDKTQPEMIPFLQRLRSLTDRYPARMMVAEIGDDHQVATSLAYTQGEDKLHTAYNFALLSPNAYSVDSFQQIINEYQTIDNAWPSWAFSNHDVRRVATRWSLDGKPNNDQVKMLNALLCSLRGTAFMYQGEELGLPEADIPFELLRDPFGIFLWPEDKGRDGCRTPYPWKHDAPQAGFSDFGQTWLPIATEHVAMSWSMQDKDSESVLNFTRRFLSWRKTQPALIRGDLEFLSAPENILAFKRSGDHEVLYCYFNLSDQEVSFEINLDLKNIFHSGLVTASENKIHMPAFAVLYLA